MRRIPTVVCRFEFTEKSEKFSILFLSKEQENKFKNKFGKIDNLINSKTIGYGLCSILNSKKELEILFEDIQNNIEKYIKIENTDNVILENNSTFFSNIINEKNSYNMYLEENINSILQKILNINKYFIIIIDKFREYILYINSRINKKINDSETKEINKIIYNSYLDILFNPNLVDSLSRYLQFITIIEETILGNNAKFDFWLPKVEITYDFRKNTHRNLKLPTLCIKDYNYTIYNFWDFLCVSYYQTALNNYHIKKCMCSSCGKYYSTKYGHTRYCYNYSPINPLKKCNEINRTIPYKDDLDNLDNWQEEEWEANIRILNRKYYSISQYFYDKAHSTSNKSMQERIMNNRKKLQSNVAYIKKIIKGNDGNKRDTYVRFYQNYLKEVKENAKNGNFKVKRLDFKTLLKDNKKS